MRKAIHKQTGEVLEVVLTKIEGEDCYKETTPDEYGGVRYFKEEILEFLDDTTDIYTTGKERKYKPYDRIIIRPKLDCGVWYCALFSYYDPEDENGFFTIGESEEGYDTSDVYVLPFENNEHLVGTSFMPLKRNFLDKERCVIACNDINGILCGHGEYLRFKGITPSGFVCEGKNGEDVHRSYCIPVSELMCNEPEEVKKHVLGVSDGKLVRIKLVDEVCQDPHIQL